MANPEQALFDSWQQGRKQGHEAGIRYEHERIIKLLENYFKPDEAKAFYQADYETYLDIIALIKGEQK